MSDQSLKNLMATLNCERSVEDVKTHLSTIGYNERDINSAIKFHTQNQAENNFRELSFTILGEPPTSKRPRVNRATLSIYAPDGGDKLNLSHQITSALPLGHIPFEGEVLLSLTVYKPIVSGFPTYKKILAELGYVRPETKPDYDNFSKIITDAMTGIVFKDDSLITVGYVDLYYSSRPRTEIKLFGRAKRMFK